MTDARAFCGFRFPAEVILWAVRCYLRFPISYRDLELMPPSMPRVQAVGDERSERLSTTTAEGRTSSPRARAVQGQAPAQPAP